MRECVVAFMAGMLFALGLGIAGMTQPAKVIGFLDVAGDWDPSLALVMIGAIAVYAPLSRLAVRRGAPLFASRFALPTRRDVDARLVIGAVLFGIGWGLAGYCPGPAVTSLASGRATAIIFVVAMLAGMVLYTGFFSGAWVLSRARSGGRRIGHDHTDHRPAAVRCQTQ